MSRPDRTMEEEMTLGDLCEDTGDIVGAVSHFAAAVALDPSDPDAQIALGEILQKQGMSDGEFGKAVRCFTLASTLAPHDPDAWHYLGCAQFLNGAFTQSASAHARGISLLQSSGADPEEVADEMLRQATSIQHAADSELDGLDAALSVYEQALDVCPGHKDAAARRVCTFWERVRLIGRQVPESTHRVLQPYTTVTLPPSLERGGSAAPNPLHSAHCMHWIGADGCATLVAAAESTGGWLSARHSDYATVDIEVSTVPVVLEWLTQRLHTTLLPTMAALFELDLLRLAARDVFIVKYSAGLGGQPSLPLHRDAYTLSFNLLLSSPDDFAGGGTHFESLDLTLRPERAGDVVMHSGQMLHGGAAVTRGVRYIIVGFVEIMGVADECPSVREKMAEHTTATGAANDGDADDPNRDWERLDRYWTAAQTP
eukprot:m.153788 g.153788  ORF g.153788 m.153788 type:complete len:428 (-) comp23468_c1_seq1:2348-3631(-)